MARPKKIIEADSEGKARKPRTVKDNDLIPKLKKKRDEINIQIEGELVNYTADQKIAFKQKEIIENQAMFITLTTEIENIKEKKYKDYLKNVKIAIKENGKTVQEFIDELKGIE